MMKQIGFNKAADYLQQRLQTANGKESQPDITEESTKKNGILDWLKRWFS